MMEEQIEDSPLKAPDVPFSTLALSSLHRPSP